MNNIEKFLFHKNPEDLWNIWFKEYLDDIDNANSYSIELHNPYYICDYFILITNDSSNFFVKYLLDKGLATYYSDESLVLNGLGILSRRRQIRAIWHRIDMYGPVENLHRKFSLLDITSTSTVDYGRRSIKHITF